MDSAQLEPSAFDARLEALQDDTTLDDDGVKGFRDSASGTHQE